ncbi:MAG: ATP-binding cassette domain-containing protein, partial [Fervidobacterium sp.]
MAELILEVTDLKKYYKNIKAVDGISFSVNEGEIFALLGPNGAGKTTTIKCILGLRKRDGGKITLNGSVGYLPEGKELYQSYTVKQLIEMTASITKDFDKNKCFDFVEKFDIPLSEKV